MFWQNDPNTTSPLSADNLSRAEKYLTATAGSNGDYYVTIPNGANVASGDLVRITFPVATDNTKNARLSINGGSTYKNIFTNANVPAYAVESKSLRLRYDGTYFVPMDAVGGVSGSWRWIQYPDGKTIARAMGASVTMAIPSAFGSLYRYISNGTNGVGVTLPTIDSTNIFVADPMVIASFISSSTDKSAPHGFNVGTYVAHLQFLSTTNSGTTTTQTVNFYVTGRWK